MAATLDPLERARSSTDQADLGGSRGNMMAGCPMRLEVKGDRHHFLGLQSLIKCPLGDDETENIRKARILLGEMERACEDWGAVVLISKQDYFRLGARSAYVCERLFDRAWQLTGEAIGEFHAKHGRGHGGKQDESVELCRKGVEEGV